MTQTYSNQHYRQEWLDLAYTASKIAEGYQTLANHDKSLADEFWDIAAPAINRRLADCDELSKYELDDFFPRYSGIIPLTTFIKRRQQIEDDVNEECAARAESHYYDMASYSQRMGE